MPFVTRVKVVCVDNVPSRTCSRLKHLVCLFVISLHEVFKVEVGRRFWRLEMTVLHATLTYWVVFQWWLRANIVSAILKHLWMLLVVFTVALVFWLFFALPYSWQTLLDFQLELNFIGKVIETFFSKNRFLSNIYYGFRFFLALFFATYLTAIVARWFKKKSFCGKVRILI